MTYQPIRTPAEFDACIIIGKTTESLHLEFKGRLGRQRPELDGTTGQGPDEREPPQVELCRDIVQFANSEGGVLLIGIAQGDGPSGRKVAERVVSVTDVERDRQWIEQAIRNYLDPATFSHTIAIIECDPGPVLAVNVPPSRHLVALWHKRPRHGIEYLYRTEHGKERMNPGEVERHLMNGSRAMSIRLAELFESKDVDRKQPVDLAPGIHTLRSGPQVTTAKHAGADIGAPIHLHGCRVIWSGNTGAEVTLTIYGSGLPAGTCVAIPHGLVREAWRTGDGRAGLCLGVKIVLLPNRVDVTYALEPA